MPLAKATEQELIAGLAPGEEAMLRGLLAGLRQRAMELARRNDAGPEQV
jgi:hypothetical protein